MFGTGQGRVLRKVQQLYNNSTDLHFCFVLKVELIEDLGSGGRDRTADLGVMIPTL